MLGGASRMSSMTWSISSTSASIETEEALSRLAASAGPLILLHDTHTGSDEKKERGDFITYTWELSLYSGFHVSWNWVS